MNIIFFFFNDTATTEIYTLSLHDALPISEAAFRQILQKEPDNAPALNYIGYMLAERGEGSPSRDRKSTCLNSSHLVISYAVFCLKKKIVGTTVSARSKPPPGNRTAGNQGT